MAKISAFDREYTRVFPLASRGYMFNILDLSKVRAHATRLYREGVPVERAVEAAVTLYGIRTGADHGR